MPAGFRRHLVGKNLVYVFHLKRTCSRVTSASSGLGVLTDYALYKSTHSLTRFAACVNQRLDGSRKGVKRKGRVEKKGKGEESKREKEGRKGQREGREEEGKGKRKNERGRGILCSCDFF